jgi:prolyl oligopeptidase
MLFGYGSLSVAMLPVYRTDVPAWLELGAMWVTANLRGGSEYGEAWHRVDRQAQGYRPTDKRIAELADQWAFAAAHAGVPAAELLTSGSRPDE